MPPKKKAAKKRKPKPAPAPEPVVAPVTVVQQPSAVITTTARFGPNPIHRFVETFAFVGGVLLLMTYMVVEILHAAGVRLGSQPTDEGFPWGTMISASLLVAPKMIGKATAGRAWSKITGRVSGSGATAEYEATGGKGGE